MGGVRLRTKFLIAMLLTSASVTALTLFVVQRTIDQRTRSSIAGDLNNSVENFRNVQSEREADLRASAGLLANLPILKALMTSRHAPTIQDASEELFRLAGRDLFVLIDPAGQLEGFHANATDLQRESIDELLRSRDAIRDSFTWWYAGGHLYEVYAEPIYFGSSSTGTPLGKIVLGYEIDNGVARQVGKLASSEVVVLRGPDIVVSTLQGRQLDQFRAQGYTAQKASGDISLGDEKFVASSVVLNPGETVPATMVVMKSYDNAIAFTKRLQRLLLVIGFAAVLLGTVLVYFIGRTFTLPLEKLAAGVSALGTGDFAFPLVPAGSGEIVELTKAFAEMRNRLRAAQESLIESERLATVGRMAGSISHDLRHPLTAVLANAEFLLEPELNSAQREELYQEIRVAVNRLTDLVDSLLELSRPAQSLTLSEIPIEHSLLRAIELVRTHPEFQRIDIDLQVPAEIQVRADPRQLERTFHNVLLNSCQAVLAVNGSVLVRVAPTAEHIEIRFTDNGPGVDASIRARLFEPFVSVGKENGTGLGLTIAQKIVQEHGGTLLLEETGQGRTVMLISLPRCGGPTQVGKTNGQQWIASGQNSAQS